jgi:hypothetical protein
MTSSEVSSPFADPRTYCYNSFLGMPIARDAAAYFLARHLLFGGEDDSGDGRDGRSRRRRGTVKSSNIRRGKKDRQEGGGSGGSSEDLLLLDDDDDDDDEGDDDSAGYRDEGQASLAARALEAVQSRHVVLATGAAALLNHLFVLLGDSPSSSPSAKSGGGSGSRRECCLIPAPYYAAFDNHCRLVADVVPFAVSQADPTSGPASSELDAAFRQAKRVR